MANGRGNPDGSPFRMELDSAKLFGNLDGHGKAAEAAVRPAAQAGAEELYLEARLRCPVSLKAHFFYGKNSKQTGVRYFFKPGALRDAIYQVFSKDSSFKGHATYHVAWNHQKVPYGFMVEFGTSRAPAHPFIRPAYDARKTFALQIARATLIERMQEAL